MKKSNKTHVKTKISPFNLILTILLVFYAFTILFSIYFIVVSALKEPLDEFDKNFFGLPKGFYLQNILDILDVPITVTDQKVNQDLTLHFVPDIFLNTILYSVGGAFFAALIPCITAYFVAKFNYKFSKFLYGLTIVVIIVPIIGNLPATYKMLNTLNLYDSILGMYITKANFVNMWFLVFYAAFKGVPNDYMEAAYIDGASEFRVMIQVILPLVKNIFFTVVLIFFVDLWNDYTTPALFLPTYPTLAYMINAFVTDSDYAALSSIPMRMASCAIMVIPTVIIFIIFKDKLMGNLTMGGIKG